MMEFIEACQTRVLLDVRSPGEFRQGHIPGAHSFPLFTDEERAQVGICYKQKGPDDALALGLELVGPKMAGFVRSAQGLAADKRVAVHCWRGGKRSQSMSWLLRTAGFDVITLTGGYKAYRQWVLSVFQDIFLNLWVLGGQTGSGKTKVLRALRDAGEQIIDLEAIACHKGSSFGAIGENPQPTVEQFENDLADALTKLDSSKRVWIENESKSIGRVFIPLDFWQKMKMAPLINIEIPENARIENLVADYDDGDRQALIEAFERIGKRLGGQHLKTAIEALEAGNLRAAAHIALHYYDKTYRHCLDTSISPDIRHIAFDHGDPQRIADMLQQIKG